MTRRSTIQVQIGDSREVLGQLAPGSVQCHVTSPYRGLRNYDHADQVCAKPSPEAHVANVVTVFRDVHRGAVRVATRTGRKNTEQDWMEYLWAITAKLQDRDPVGELLRRRCAGESLKKLSLHIEGSGLPTRQGFTARA